MQMEGKVHLLENKSQVMYKVKFTFKNPKVHCQKVINVKYTKNLDFDLQVTFGQLLTFGKTVDKSQYEP